MTDAAGGPDAAGVPTVTVTVSLATTPSRSLHSTSRACVPSSRVAGIAKVATSPRRVRTGWLPSSSPSSDRVTVSSAT
jgi:hypothetical protein